MIIAAENGGLSATVWTRAFPPIDCQMPLAEYSGIPTPFGTERLSDM